MRKNIIFGIYHKLEKKKTLEIMMKKKNEVRKTSLFANNENHQKINVNFINENDFVFVNFYKN